MPIPLLFIAAGLGTGLLGVGKGVKAGFDQMEANDTNNAAERKAKVARENMDISRKNCGAAIDNLGYKKIEVLNGSVQNFIYEFEKLNHVTLSESVGLNELHKLVLDKTSFAELKELQGMATSMVDGITSGAMAGAVTAFGAYSAAGVLATASTGTAIASLSGVAATNATLAFFGGGSLAAGGLGMAGGTMVLGGLVAGPALAVLGFVVGAKASENLDNAQANYAQAKSFEEEINMAIDLSNGIRRRSEMFNRFLIRLQTVLDPMIYEMAQIIEIRGTDFRNFSKEEADLVASAMSITGAIKAILDTAILDEAGNLTVESGNIIATVQSKLS